MEEDQSLEVDPQFAAPAPKRKINKRFVYLIAVVLFLIVAFIGYKTLNSSKSNQNNAQINLTPTEAPLPTVAETTTPTETLTPVPTDTPTPRPTSNPVDSASGLDRSNISVVVENGSGEAGVAKNGADLLISLGYNVASTANADNFDYLNVTIKIKSSLSKYLPLLKKDLNTQYTVGDTSSDLPDSNPSDAIVIIGK